MNFESVMKAARLCYQEVRTALGEHKGNWKSLDEVATYLQKQPYDPRIHLCFCPCIGQGEIYFVIPAKFTNAPLGETFLAKWHLFMQRMEQTVAGLEIVAEQDNPSDSFNFYRAKVAVKVLEQ